MSLWHPVSKAIFDSLVKSPGGFQLDPKKGPAILNEIARDPPKSNEAFHDMLGLLVAMNGKPAADQLRTLVLDAAMKKAAPPRPSGGSGSWFRRG